MSNEYACKACMGASERQMHAGRQPDFRLRLCMQAEAEHACQDIYICMQQTQGSRGPVAFVWNAAVLQPPTKVEKKYNDPGRASASKTKKWAQKHTTVPVIAAREHGKRLPHRHRAEQEPREEERPREKERKTLQAPKKAHVAAEMPRDTSIVLARMLRPCMHTCRKPTFSKRRGVGERSKRHTQKISLFFEKRTQEKNKEEEK